MTIPTKAPRDPPCNPFLAAALFAQSQNLAFMFSPPIQLNVTCLVLSRTCVSSRFALPGRSVPGALCSRLETGECAKPWFQPFLMPFELLLLMQCSSRQMCLSDAELICLIYPPPFFFVSYLCGSEKSVGSDRGGNKRWEINCATSAQMLHFHNSVCICTYRLSEEPACSHLG